MAESLTSTSRVIKSTADWVLPVAAVSIVFIMLIPIPAFVLDLLLTVSITASLLVLLTAIQILKPVEFSVFPSLLLLLTMLRLSLNMASSRRILLHGSEGTAAAGHVIEAFGQFVVGGNYVVGFVLFLALIAIQYLVVSHGAVRTAEVTARFTLDAMPGKQMAIDADLNAGLIDETAARERREYIARESEFYGSMDGAARFSQRDAMATILITAINIIAGFLIGVFQNHMTLLDALQTYTILTVGDGLATMVPSLLVSVAGAIVITRATSDSTLSVQLKSQLLSRPKGIWIAAGVLGSLALIPGLPKLSFLLMAAALVILGRRMKPVEAMEAAAAAETGPKPGSTEQIEPLMKLEELALEVGYGLVPLVDENQGGKLLQRIRSLRKQLALQLGFIIPSIHITDNLQLQPREYLVSLRGVEIGRWEMHQDNMLAISSDVNPPPLEGKETREPAFGVAARWIPPALQERALAEGYAVVDQTSVMATHIAELVKQHAHDLLTRQETRRLLDTLAESQPKLVDELVPKLLTLGEVQKILQQLLREQVSIRDLTTILETLLEAAAVNKNPILLVEAVRQSLGRALVQPLLEDGKLNVFTLAPMLEAEVSRAFDAQANGAQATGLQPSLVRRIHDGMRKLMSEHAGSTPLVLICPTPGRFYLRRLLEPSMPRLIVLSPGEIPPRVAVHSLGTIS
jgi:flagellar biosynthesis protein FlhA